MSQYSVKLAEQKDKLLLLGYHNYQINQIIRDTVEEVEEAALTEEQQENVINTLQEYIDFALKCRKKMK